MNEYYETKEEPELSCIGTTEKDTFKDPSCFYDFVMQNGKKLRYDDLIHLYHIVFHEYINFSEIETK